MDTLLESRKAVFTPKSKKNNKEDEVRIAIVEDDPMFRHAIEYYLKKDPGNRVFSFESGEECFRHYHQLDPEIMILDYRLNEIFESGKMNGLDILQEIKSVKPETEIIFLSGQDSFDIATAAIKGGASDYIVKDDKALTKMLTDVNRMAFFIRAKREDLKTLKWTIYLTGFVILLIAIAYLTGYDNYAGVLNILFIAACATGIGFLAFIFMKRKTAKAHQHPPSEKEEKPGIWHD
ncbi:MAG TPA: response regulator [Bacteroidia bacterium]|nr:response regulator [Bacteroidia bacterium]